VQEAIESAGTLFVETRELQKAAGEYIADLLGVEAALPTPGCAAAVMFSIAGCMAGNDPEKQGRIPDTTGMKNEVVLQEPHHYAANRMYEVPGARIVYAGSGDSCTAEELASAIGPNTAAIGYEVRQPNHPDWTEGTLPIEDAVRVAREKGVPVIADAASQSDPPDYLRHNALAADLVCFGAKYFGGPNNGGFVCGTRDLVEAAAAHNFVAEAHGAGFMPWGRAHKLDRIAIVATVAALEEWLTADHEDRVIEYRRRASVVQDGVSGIAGVDATASDDGNYVEVTLSAPVTKTAEQVVSELDAGEPRVMVSGGGDAIRVAVFPLNPGDESVVAERLGAVLRL
jgi:seryl-tRNA(Sec) selenium transferase